jgi:dephospho-CoA kinase
MTKNKTAVVSSGRFQGIHHGHALLVNKTVSHAKSIGADHYIYPTRTQDNDKNPIEHNEKVSIMRGLFPQANIASDSDVRNPIEAVKKMSQKGYRHVKLIAGQDRIPQFQASIGAYVKKKTDKDFDPKKHIDLDSFEVVSAGDRDPDAEGVQGASGTKMREYVRKGDFGSFAKSVPTNNAKLSRRMFNAMRKGMAVKQLKEEVTRKELAPMLDSFVSFASDKLGLKSMPNIRYKTEDDDYNSFAAYNPSSNELSIHTMNRHPMDIFRSIAHELVHHKQNEDGRLGKDIAKEGTTGSDIENEANSEAGKIMRWFAKANPDMFNKTYVVETNTAAMGGVRGLGNVTGEVSPTEVSQYVLDNQAYTQQLQNNNTEQLYTFNDDNSWMDKKGKQEYQAKSLKAIRARAQLNEGINDPGKLKAIFLAGGPGSGKDYVMNATLAGEGLKEINSDVAFEYLMQKNGLDLEMPDEERVERDIVRGRAKNITKEQERLALAGRLGLIINGTADDLEKIKRIKKELEADGYETMMVFVNTSNEVSRERNVERGKMGKRKVPDGTDKQGVPDNSPNVRQEKWDLAQKNIGELQKIFGNENFAVIDNTADIRKVGPEEKEKIQINFNRIRRMAQQFVRSENQNPAAKAWIDREVQKRGITQ